jgi:ribosomal protein L32E
MSSWEKVLEEHRQEETFMKRCRQRLQKLKEERREARELEEKLRVMLGTFQIPPNSGFRGE